MEKDRSIGFLIFCLFLFLYGFIIVGLTDNIFIDHSAPDFLRIGTDIINSILFIILIVEFFRFQSWARLALIWGSVLFVIWGWICFLTSWNPLGVMGLGALTYIIYPNGMAIPVIIYLTRPKVKEQFK